MIRKLTLIAVCALICSYSHADQQVNGTNTPKTQESSSQSSSPQEKHSLKGYWVNKRGKAIAEITNNKAIITLLNDDEDVYTLNYVKISDHIFELTGERVSHSPKMIVNWEKNYFYIKNLTKKGQKITFKPAPNLTDDEVNGTWYTYEKDGYFESSVIVHQRDTSYDYDSLEIDHDEEVYGTYIDLDMKSIFTNGFMYKDPATDDQEEYIYYITSHSKDKKTLTFTDSTGYQWKQVRMPNAKHIAIPEGYKKEEFEE